MSYGDSEGTKIENSYTTSSLTEPTPLDGTAFNYYANGQIIEQGTDMIPLATSNSTHPVTKDEFQLVNLDEIACLNWVDSGAVDAFIIDDVSTGYNKTHEFPSTNIDPFGTDYTHGYRGDIDMGDVDGDGMDEIIIIDDDSTWGNILIFDDKKHNYTKIGDFQVTNPPGNHKSVCTGDIDGDGIDEIVYARYVQGSTQPVGISCSVALWVYKFYPTWTCLTPYQYRVKNGYYEYSNIFDGTYDPYFMNAPELACGDIDADGMDEIACVFPFRNAEPFYEDIWLFDYDVSTGNFIRTWSSWLWTELNGDMDVAFGDFDGDGFEEIAVSATYWDGTWLHGQLKIIEEDFT